MNKPFIICLLSLFLYAFNCWGDEQKPPGDLKNTLLIWNQLYESMSKRLSKLEKNFKTKLIQEKEYTSNNDEIKNSITNLNARIDKVEETGSLLETHNIATSFKETIDVLNERSSKMEKRLEDLEVTVAVIEKIYRVSQNPLKSLMKIIDEQAVVINTIEERLEKQEAMLLAMRKDSQDALTYSEPDEKSEPEVISSEKETTMIHETVADTETPDTEEAEEQTLLGQEKDVFVENVSFYSTGSSTKIRGEIVNKSNVDYSVGNIEIQFYDENEDLLERLDVITINLRKGSTNKFDQFVFGVDLDTIAKYIILFNDMLLTTFKGEIVVQNVEEKKATVVEVENKVSQPVPAKEKTTYVAYTPPVVDEGPKPIGNDFYIKNVTFSEFGSSTVMKGEIKNDSRESASIASFSLKVVAKDSDKKTEKNFTIININSNETKPFEQTIEGILPSQISDYQVVLKEKR